MNIEELITFLEDAHRMVKAQVMRLDLLERTPRHDTESLTYKRQRSYVRNAVLKHRKHLDYIMEHYDLNGHKDKEEVHDAERL